MFHLRPLANSAMMSTLNAHCQWEDETVRERTGHPSLYAAAKKMKSLTLHTHGCLRASFWTTDLLLHALLELEWQVDFVFFSQIANIEEAWVSHLKSSGWTGLG